MVLIDPNWAPDYVQRVLEVEQEENHTICGAALPSGEPCRKWASSTIGRCLKHADDQTIEHFFKLQQAAPALTASAPDPAPADTAPAATVAVPRKPSRQLYFWLIFNAVLLLAVLILFSTHFLTSLQQDDEQWFAAGEKEFNAGNYKMALEHYKRLREAYPASPRAEQAKQRYEECLSILERKNYEALIQLQPDSEQAREAYLKIAETHQAQGNFAEAIRNYESYIGMTAEPARQAATLMKISVCYQQQGQLATAIQTYQRILDRYPNDPNVPEVLFGLGHLNQELDNRTEAVRFFEQVREKYPGSKWAGEAEAALSQLR